MQAREMNGGAFIGFYIMNTNLSGIVNAVDIQSFLAEPDGLKVKWFDTWQPQVAEAIAALPDIEGYPQGFYNQLLQHSGPMPKRIALVSEKGQPAAVIGLRPRGAHWEPLTQWLLPGGLLVARPGYTMRVLKRLGLDIWAAWWRTPAPEPCSTTRFIQSTPTHRMDLTQNYEFFWRETGIFKTIRKVRNRCREFRFEVNRPGAAEWTIRNWEQRWRSDPAQETPQLADRLFIARTLEHHSLHYTFSLCDQDEIIAGATVFVHKNDLVAGVNYRKPEYDWHGVNERLIELVFTWATAAGYKIFDIGGGHEYKAKWAPQVGERLYIHTCPGYLYYAHQAVQKVLNLKQSPQSERSNLAVSQAIAGEN
jgi:hypothetical protein